MFGAFFLFTTYGIALADDPRMSPKLTKECRLWAANSATKIYPAYHIEKIGFPQLEKSFTEKDEFGKQIYRRQVDGRMSFRVGDISGHEHFSCFFVSYDEKKWTFNWSGIGPTEWRDGVVKASWPGSGLVYSIAKWPIIFAIANHHQKLPTWL
jgi:hypothetical protein